MARFTVLLLVAVFTVALRRVNADKDVDKEIHEAMIPIIAECSKEHGANPDDVMASKKSKDLDGIDGCLIECVFKKIGVMDDEGTFVVEKFAESAKKFLKEEGDSEKFEELGKTCASVNEKKFEDKCGKSKMLLACVMEEKDKLVL